jgi:hypothetical protein
LQGILEGDKKGRDLLICICVFVQANLEGEKEIYVVSSLSYIVLFVVADYYFWV